MCEFTYFWSSKGPGRLCFLLSSRCTFSPQHPGWTAVQLWTAHGECRTLSLARWFSSLQSTSLIWELFIILNKSNLPVKYSYWPLGILEQYLIPLLLDGVNYFKEATKRSRVLWTPYKNSHCSFLASRCFVYPKLILGVRRGYVETS